MNAAAQTTEAQKGWPDDLLKRHGYSVFLTTYLEGKCGPDKPSIVAALDAPWGLGKSFFVQHWSEDLKNAGRPVLFFNAWENDSAQDPAISLMAKLHEELEPLYESLPDTIAAKIEIRNKGQKLFKAFRRAALPTAAVIAKGLFKKATGIAIDELSDAISPDKGESNEAERQSSKSQGGDTKNGDKSHENDYSKTIDDSLDAFFEKSMEVQSQKLNAVVQFRNQLEELLRNLSETNTKNGPFWIFIDELDRCRPDYAIALLEGIKHLFSVKGVVFVVSTNLDQLSKAVGAVYGVNFDGYQYLKRFFNVEYTLPEPTRRDFINALAQNTVLENLGGCTGADPSWTTPSQKSSTAAMSIVAEAMQLDLRSIQSVFAVTEAVILGMKPIKEAATMSLFFLAAVRHKNPTLLKKLETASDYNPIIKEVCTQLLTGPTTVPTRRMQRDASRIVNLEEVLTFFFRASKQSVRTLINQVDGGQNMQYPENLTEQLVHFNDLRADGLHPIHKYPQLLNVAGHMTS